MKTKDVKVRAKDIKNGVTIYVSHPVYGIEKNIVRSRPYKAATGAMFFKTYHIHNGEIFESERSLLDAGITGGDSYNGRRTFFKQKHAQEWMNKWSKDRGFIKQHSRHVEMLKD